MSAFEWVPLRAAHAMPRRPNYIEKEAACFRFVTGIAWLGAVGWTQFYSKSAYREAQVRSDAAPSKYPPAKPGALWCEPLKAVGGVAGDAL